MGGTHASLYDHGSARYKNRESGSVNAVQNAFEKESGSESGEIASCHWNDHVALWNAGDTANPSLCALQNWNGSNTERETRENANAYRAASLPAEGERRGPAWEVPEGFKRFSCLLGERRRLELGPGMGEQAGG